MATALITGASGGIGMELAKIFASKGDDLVLVARSLEKLEKLKVEIEQQHKVSVTIIKKDLSGLNAAADVFDETQSKNLAIDYLVNNAGLGEYGLFAETDWQKELQMIEVNILALTHLTKLFLSQMLKRNSGRILNVASTAAFQPGPQMAVYYASKAYVLHFSEAVNYELRKTNITVTALCPGPTESEFFDVADMRNTVLAKGKIASSKEVAEYGYKAMMNGEAVAIHGIRNKLLALGSRFSPRKLVLAIANKMQSKKR